MTSFKLLLVIMYSSNHKRTPLPRIIIIKKQNSLELNRLLLLDFEASIAGACDVGEPQSHYHFDQNQVDREEQENLKSCWKWQ